MCTRGDLEPKRKIGTSPTPCYAFLVALPRRPKILERRPDPPPPTSFEIDDEKLRRATEPNDRWLDEWPGKIFLVFGYGVLIAIGLALLAGLVLLLIAFPGFGVG